MKSVPRLSGVVCAAMAVLAVLLVPFFASQESIINTVQQLYGLLSMPILSAFIVGLAFRNVDARAAIIGVVSGVGIYAYLSFVWTPFHYIHAMFVTLIASVLTSLIANRLIFRRREEIAFGAAAA